MKGKKVKRKKKTLTFLPFIGNIYIVVSTQR